MRECAECAAALSQGRTNESRSGGSTHQGLGFLNVFMAEEKLSIEIAEVNGVEIDDVNLAKAGQNQVLEQFAADATGADEKDARLERWGNRSASRYRHQYHYRRGSLRC